jgi:hypothetical protein
LGVRLGHRRRGPWTKFVIAAHRNGIRLTFGLSTRDQDALFRKASNDILSEEILSEKV